MNEDQIWQQLDIRAAPLCSHLQLLEGDAADDADLPGEMFDDEEDEEDEEEDASSDQSGDTEGMEDSEEEAFGSEEVTDLREESEDEDELDRLSLPDAVHAKRSSKRSSSNAPNSGLDDDFFSLDAFNRETEEAEASAISRGRLGRDSDYDDDDYDDDDIDLFKPVDDVEDLDEDASGDGAGMQFCILFLFMA